MASPALVDVDALIEPVSEGNAVGDDLRTDHAPDSLYAKVRDARRAARSAERINMFDGDSAEANENWQQILELAPRILTEHSKDLEVACWYTEALIRKAGFQGLREGFSIIRSLIENYWDQDLYPIADEDGIETRVAPLTGLNGEGAEGVLLAPIRNTHITEDIPPGPFNLWQYKQAVDVKRIQDEDARAEQSAKIGFSLDDIENVVEQSCDGFYADLRDDVDACLAQYRHINQLLIDLCGSEHAPPTSKIIELLEDTLSAINHLAKYKLPAEASNEDATEAQSGDEVAMNPAQPTAVAGAIKNREEALRQLNAISEFFRKTEPHSPISYVIDKAIKWGDMSLAELMQELLPDHGSRETYGALTGVNVNEE